MYNSDLIRAKIKLKAYNTDMAPSGDISAIITHYGHGRKNGSKCFQNINEERLSL